MSGPFKYPADAGEAFDRISATLATEGRWVKGAHCKKNGKDLGYCLSGAINLACLGHPGDHGYEPTVYPVVLRAVAAAIPDEWIEAQPTTPTRQIGRYNDDAAVSHKDIVALLGRARQLA